MNRRARDRVIAKLLPLGWVVIGRTKAGHYKLRHVSGATYFMSYSPSDYRSIKNAVAGMRRIGRGLC